MAKLDDGAADGAAFALRLDLAWAADADRFGEVAAALRAAGGRVVGVEAVCELQAPPERAGQRLQRWTVHVPDLERQRAVVEAAKALRGRGVECFAEVDLAHARHEGGLIAMRGKEAPATEDDLARLHSPGAARVGRTIISDPDTAFRLTRRRNAVALISDGSAVAGLGDAGPAAALPAVEARALLFREFAGVDAVALCVPLRGVEELAGFAAAAAAGFGGVALTGISAPRGFAVEAATASRLELPVLLEDARGMAVVVAAALYNALERLDKDFKSARVVVTGMDDMGIACAGLLAAAGMKYVVGVDRLGALYAGREDGMNAAKKELAEATNPEGLRGSLADVLPGADVLVEASGEALLTAADLRTMAPGAVFLSLTGAELDFSPESLRPHVAVTARGGGGAGAELDGLLASPGIFRGALDVRAARVTTGMCLAASRALAEALSRSEAAATGRILPTLFDRSATLAVAEAVRRTARSEGVARELGPLPGVDFPAPF